MRRVLFFVLIGLLGTGILCALGVWQVQRLTWKQQVLDEINGQIMSEPVALPDAPTPEEHKYLPVIMTGTIEEGEVLVYVSVKQIGPGYRIIAPFRVGDRRILIDRGFVPASLRDAERVTGEIEVRGNLHWPDEVDKFTPEPELAYDMWFARDVPSISAALETEPVMLIAATRTDTNILPMPVDTAGIPNNHLQYAITWFLLAAVWMVMTLYFIRRGPPIPKPNSRD